MRNPILSHIANNFHKAFGDAFGLGNGPSLEELYQSITLAPDNSKGDYAVPMFRFAKGLKLAPNQIGEKLKDYLQGDHYFFEGPYVNVSLEPTHYGPKLLNPILNRNFFDDSFPLDHKKTMIEYSQPNTHKEMHVGHMRNLCLGNALTRIKKYLGLEVITATYPGDSGAHVAKALWYLKTHHKGPFPTSDRGAWLGKIYTKAHLLLEDQRGSEFEETNRQELTAILKELEQESGPSYELWKETRQWSIDLMKTAYRWADVNFDHWYFESEMDRPSLELAREWYEKGLLVKDQGAIGIDLSEYKLGFCILIKSDGNGLYATKDLALAKHKFEQLQIEESLYIVDVRQAHHFKQVFKILELFGFPQAKDCAHLPYNFVELPDGAMSSRKGNIVPLMDIFHRMEDTIRERYLEKYRGDWTDQEIADTATAVANGAIKYGMLRFDTNRKIVFDSEEWLKLEGETGPYLQYVFARIQAIMRKTSLRPDTDRSHLLTAPQERKLLVHLTFFNETVITAHQKNQTVGLCSYLYDLAKLFNSFYAECSISKAETTELSQGRLALAMAAGEVMNQGLALLGIPAPEKM